MFDIIGPVMIGPSSSHTAGAVRIARAGFMILGEDVRKAVIGLVGSFAQTYRGHGTDRALIAGLLGMFPDDERIRDSFEIAKERGLEFTINEMTIPRAHPNTVHLHLTGASGKECAVQGASIGGGNILIHSVNEMETEFSGEADTLIIAHQDMPGVIAEVTSLMAWHGVNIGNFKLTRPHKGFHAVMSVAIDGEIDLAMVDKLRGLPHIGSVVYLPANRSA
ncbi:MAG: L-serine ammonia-lyase, iron-sulfur-dependent subunit beta [Treponemataceae bacterium]|nr:MAG: L-serine ammonia-lyase, iron-sulfur-dependent subunit beta [Treponemataceae bacterium]